MTEKNEEIREILDALGHQCRERKHCTVFKAWDCAHNNGTNPPGQCAYALQYNVKCRAICPCICHDKT